MCQEGAEKAVLVRILELRGADMWSGTATIVGAERDESHRGPAAQRLNQTPQSQRTAVGGSPSLACQRVTLMHR